MKTRAMREPGSVATAGGAPGTGAGPARDAEEVTRVRMRATAHGGWRFKTITGKGRHHGIGVAGRRRQRLVLRVIKGGVIASRRRRIKSEPGDKRHRGEGIEQGARWPGWRHGTAGCQRGGEGSNESAGGGEMSRNSSKRRVVVEQGLEELRVRGHAERLRKHIRELCRRLYPARLVNATGDAVTKFVSVAEDVLRLLVSHGVRGKLNGGLAVEVKRGRCRDAEPEVLKEVADEDAFAASEGGSVALSFGRRRGNGSLLTCPPSHGAASKHGKATRGRAAGLPG